MKCSIMEEKIIYLDTEKHEIELQPWFNMKNIENVHKMNIFHWDLSSW